MPPTSLPAAFSKMKKAIAVPLRIVLAVAADALAPGRAVELVRASSAAPTAPGRRGFRRAASPIRGSRRCSGTRSVTRSPFSAGRSRRKKGSANIGAGAGSDGELAGCRRRLPGSESQDRLVGGQRADRADGGERRLGREQPRRQGRSAARSVSAESRSISSSLAIGRPNSSICRAICAARLAGLSADMISPARYCARARSSSSWRMLSPARSAVRR